VRLNLILVVLQRGLQELEKLKLQKILLKHWQNSVLFLTALIQWTLSWLENSLKDSHQREHGHVLINLTESIFKFCLLLHNNCLFFLEKKQKVLHKLNFKAVKLNYNPLFQFSSQ
jgi:hypothetical protein